MKRNQHLKWEQHPYSIKRENGEPSPKIKTTPLFNRRKKEDRHKTMKLPQLETTLLLQRKRREPLPHVRQKEEQNRYTTINGNNTHKNNALTL